MLSTRVIPVLLLAEGGLVKTVSFQEPDYVGDPINAVRIFNDSEVDEIIVLDIEASDEGREPDYDAIHDLASECFMPLCYGGGVSSMEHFEKLFRLGVEKVSINTAIATQPNLLSQSSKAFGSQAVVAAIDVRKHPRDGYQGYFRRGRQAFSLPLDQLLESVQAQGAGEVMLTSIDQEGRQTGYDIQLIAWAKSRLSIPLIANGGAGNLSHLAMAADAGASAAAAGSLFVFQGKHKAVLINYPSQQVLADVFAGTYKS